jgi:hypothetical protein
MTEEVSLKDHSTAPNLQGNNKALSGHQPQGAEAAGASEEGMGINPESSIAYSVEKIRATLQEHAKLQFRSKRRLPKAKSAEASFTYYFMLLSLCTRVRRQPTTFGFCCFGKPFSSFLGPAPITTTITTHSYPRPAARRAPARSTVTRLPGRV